MNLDDAWHTIVDGGFAFEDHGLPRPDQLDLFVVYASPIGEESGEVLAVGVEYETGLVSAHTSGHTTPQMFDGIDALLDVVASQAAGQGGRLWVVYEDGGRDGPERQYGTEHEDYEGDA